MATTLTNDQQQALDKITYWFKHASDQTFFLSGYAGTGKTTIIQPIIRQLHISIDSVGIACYTGKAALVLSNKLNDYLEATTIHKLIYYPDDESEKVTFKKKHPKHLKHIQLIIIDEASMVSRKIYNDLLSFGIKILFIGDIGQLPPVTKAKSNQVVFNRPDFLLEEIHRQAQDNPIIRLSYNIRNKITVPIGNYGDKNQVQIITKKDFEQNNYFKQASYLHADQIICGRNTTRQRINQEVRQLHGFSGELPIKDDKIICLKNNWDVNIGSNPLVNGFIGKIVDVLHVGAKHLTVKFVPIDYPSKPVVLKIAKSKFMPNMKQEDMFKSKLNFFDFGYAITCHKSQGSQWGNVLVMNEVLNRQTHHQWLYTATTRTEENIIIVV